MTDLRMWAFGGLLLVLVMGGCSREDTDRLANIGKITRERTKEKLGEIEDEYFGSKYPITLFSKNNQLAHRVRQRFKSDQLLTDLKVDVFVEEKTVELKGTVPQQAQKVRLLELDKQTRGVEKVKDSIKVGKVQKTSGK